jgi:prepilin peptidase CpaA
MLVELLVLAVFPGLMILAGISDLFTMTIPNRISLGLIGGFCVVAAVAGIGFPAFAMHLGVAVAVLIFGFCLFSFGLLGGGDAKLLAATALWFGWADLMPFLFATTLFGGALAIGLLMARKMPLPVHLNNISWIARLHTQGEGAPYGLAIAAGALFAYPNTPWLALAG